MKLTRSGGGAGVEADNMDTGGRIKLRFPASRSVGRLGLLLVMALVAFGPTVARARIPIEKAMRLYQERYNYIATTVGEPYLYVPWPPMVDSSGNVQMAPPFPPDGFYGDLDSNPDEAVSLVGDLQSAFFSEYVVYWSFLNTPDGIQGFQGLVPNVVYLSNTNFPNDPAPDLSNYQPIFNHLLSDIQQLQYVLQYPVQTNIAYIDVNDTNATMIDCATAMSDVTSAWNASGWNTNYHGSGAPDNLIWVREYTLSWEPGYSGAALTSQRGTIYCDLSKEAPGGVGNVFLQVAWYTNGPGTDPPSPVPVAGVYEKYDTVAGGSLYNSPWLANTVPSFPNGCPAATNAQPYQYGWWIVTETVVYRPNFPERVDLAPSCSSCSGGGCNIAASSYQLGSLAVSYSLGKMHYGDAVGYIYLRSENSTTNMGQFNASSVFLNPSSSYTLTTGMNSTNWEFLTPQVMADVWQWTSNSYTIYFHPINDVVTNLSSTTPYTTNSATAFKTVTVQAVGTNQVFINETGSSTSGSVGYTLSTTYTYTAPDQWEMTQGPTTNNVLRDEIISNSWSTNGWGTNVLATLNYRTNTDIVKDGFGNVDSQTVKIYTLFPWGQELTLQVTGTGNTAMTNQWLYYSNSATDGTNYSHLKQIIEPTGRWQTYQYDLNGCVTQTVSQVMNSAPGSPNSSNRVVSVIYSTNAPQVTTVTTLLGTEVARGYQAYAQGVVSNIVCQYPGDSWTAASNLVTQIWYTDGSGKTNIPALVINPDGTIVLSTNIFSYPTSRTYITATGVPAAGYASVADGTSTASVFDGMGNPVSVTATDMVSSQVIQSQSYSNPDFLGRPQTTTYIDGSTSTSIYEDCCGIGYAVDRDGVSSTNTYDGLRRLATTCRLGVSNLFYYDGAGRTVATVRQGSDGTTATNQTA